MKNQDNVRLHQFNGSVAISFPDTKQLYLTPEMANQLANELKRFAKSVRGQTNPGYVIATRTVNENGKAVTESSQKKQVEYI